MRLLTVICTILTIGSGAFAATIDLGGTIKGVDGAAVSGAVVWLASNKSLRDTTDSSGKFTISGGTGINPAFFSARSLQSAGTLCLSGDQLQFTLGAAAQNGAVSIFSGDGKRCAYIPLGSRGPGLHRQTLPVLAAGIYVMRFTVDRFDATLQMLTAGDGTFTAGTFSGVSGTPVLSRSSAAAIIDTLMVAKADFDTLREPLTSYENSSLALVLKKKSTGPTLPPITDYSKRGPFETVKETRVGPGSGYTVFRPKTLGEDGFLHAPIVFGPGIGQTVEPVHTEMLTNFASHGFVVVGTPVLNEGPNGKQNLKTMTDGLNWIVKENTTAGSKYEGKLWADHCVSMGFSVGGTSAVEMGGEAPVITVVSIHGHKAEAALHGTMLQTTGTADNVGLPMQQWTFDRSKVPTFMATKTGAPHQEIEKNGGGEERKVIVAWMRYRIYNDTGAKSFFYGKDCVCCKAPWENPQRANWDE